MARMKFICDAERCIECNGCVTACKAEHDVPWGVNRRRVVTLNDGIPGEKSISVAACTAPMHPAWRCAPSIASTGPTTVWCCTTRMSALAAATVPTPAPSVHRSSRLSTFGARGKMDKCTFCAGGPETNGSEAEYEKYGRNRLAEGKLPACAEMCSTKALLGGDGDVVADIFRTRVLARGKGSEIWGWGTAYGSPSNGSANAPQQPKAGSTR